MPRKISRFGWVPDLPDARDYLYAAPPERLSKLPPSVDLRPSCPPVYDQGQLGSCTANAIGAAHQFQEMQEQIPDAFMPSRLFVYYNERVMENTVDSDSGAMIRDGIKSIGTEGVCPETMWPYDIAKFRNRPPAECYQEAVKHKAILYRRISHNLLQMKGCLAGLHPFVFGFTVYESFEGEQAAETGHAAMPLPGEHAIGGHAVLAVGYDDGNSWFIVRNSWGETWGMKGYFTLPYQYLLDSNLADDFWTIRLVQQP
jgi:C1A family cysteine protease